jgi:hypothetical protein
MVTASPLRLFHTWHEQQKAKRTDVLAERILAEMRRRQAYGWGTVYSPDARTQLPFSAELLTRLFGAEPAEVFRALSKLGPTHLAFHAGWPTLTRKEFRRCRSAHLERATWKFRRSGSAA